MSLYFHSASYFQMFAEEIVKMTYSLFSLFLKFQLIFYSLKSRFFKFLVFTYPYPGLGYNGGGLLDLKT